MLTTCRAILTAPLRFYLALAHRRPGGTGILTGVHNVCFRCQLALLRMASRHICGCSGRRMPSEGCSSGLKHMDIDCRYPWPSHTVSTVKSMSIHHLAHLSMCFNALSQVGFLWNLLLCESRLHAKAY